jgi:Putative prokaryotic signal transducing protein
MDMVTIFRTFNLGEAEVMRSRLTSAGFTAEIADENSATNFDVATGGFRLMVPDSEAAEAKSLLDSSEPAKAEGGDE